MVEKVTVAEGEFERSSSDRERTAGVAEQVAESVDPRRPPGCIDGASWNRRAPVPTAEFT